MSRFSDYSEAAGAAVDSGQNLVIVPRVELLDPNGSLLASDDPSVSATLWAPGMERLQLDPARTLSRTVTFRLDVGSGWVPRSVGDALHPETGSRIRVRAGIEVDGVERLWTLATLLVKDVTATSSRGAVTVEFSAVDPGRPLQANLVDRFAWDEGEPVEAVVQRLTGLVSDVEVAATGFKMPAAGTYPAGRVIADLAAQLLGSCGHELSVDAGGQLFTRAVPPTTLDGAERWVYGVDGGGLPVDRAERSWAAQSPQGVIVESGDLLTESAVLSVQVWDTDPASAGYYGGPGEVSVETLAFEHVVSPRQMATAGYARLRRTGSGPARAVVEIAPNPAMQLDDQVQLHVPELGFNSALMRVMAIDMPVVPDQLQRVGLRTVWDPQLNYGSPADPVNACVFSASDGFDRADQNLEDLQAQPGSPLWTELAWSWGVVGRAAVQRHSGTWSLALWNTPLCSSDHIAYAEIGTVPAGKYIGPAVRSSGQFDGYAALVDSSGRITLEAWQAGLRVAILGSYATRQDPSNRSLSLQAVGSTLTVRWEGVVVLTATDSRRAGPFCGMLGLGGVQGSTAPSVTSWSANTVSS